MHSTDHRLVDQRAQLSSPLGQRTSLPRRRHHHPPPPIAFEDAIGFEDLRYDDGIAKISLVGAGMRSHPGVSATFFAALSDAGVNVEMISTSEIRISVVTRAESAAAAVQAVHTAFGLDADGEAVVYGGTGR